MQCFAARCRSQSCFWNRKKTVWRLFFLINLVTVIFLMCNQTTIWIYIYIYMMLFGQHCWQPALLAKYTPIFSFLSLSLYIYIYIYGHHTPNRGQHHSPVPIDCSDVEISRVNVGRTFFLKYIYIYIYMDIYICTNYRFKNTKIQSNIWVEPQMWTLEMWNFLFKDSTWKCSFWTFFIKLWVGPQMWTLSGLKFLV